MLSQVTNAQYQQEQAARNSGGAGGNGARPSGPPSAFASQGPPQLGALSFQPGNHLPGPQPPAIGPQAHQRDSGGLNPLLQNPAQARLGQSSPPLAGPAPMSAARQQSPPPPAVNETKRVFGVTLARLYERDGLVVPMVVNQCIQAVDLFGLNMDGIYRQSGSLNSINKLKTMFDAGKTLPFEFLFLFAVPGFFIIANKI